VHSGPNFEVRPLSRCKCHISFVKLASFVIGAFEVEARK
jgi:hypothetical protein